MAYHTSELVIHGAKSIAVSDIEWLDALTGVRTIEILDEDGHRFRVTLHGDTKIKNVSRDDMMRLMPSVHTYAAA